ncbi:PstS family phosphate ABC transporter substrate-binding protein [Natrarchaeobius oligotrophus]|uniref:PstS family phosphate ABC transporter substrate-binding protein n=1 Tax=Natrarchaeobius chitinivorans TaxID=1679083 RepID=A0A3N6MVH4_NATCH|nr:PstS family phosphate ABC transporter substrate-binding protein [Natrarchaeobius chitinivorans]RQH00332.1 PstS family phosphate ABC transporter substrate-binding protein [Natrarchaeobius chitinivorans]
MANEPTAGRAGGLSRRRVLLGVAGTTLSALAGCIARGRETDLEGEILMDGSNTVLPHGAVVSEEFQWRNNRVQIPVRGSGTGAGFQRFCDGETDVQNASRRIFDDGGDDEGALCEANGIEYVELQTALDGIAVYVNPENDWCDCLTTDELERIWESGSDIDTWSDVRDEWPDEELELYGRDPASGTFDYFTEEITGEVGNIRSDYSASADTNVIVRGVRGDRYALGFGGAGYYYENEDDLELVAVDDGDACIEPTRSSIEDGSYEPLTRPLYTYFRADALEREEVRAFAQFYFEEIDGPATEADVVESGETLSWTQWGARRVGFYGISDERLQEEAQTLRHAIAEVLE